MRQLRLYYGVVLMAGVLVSCNQGPSIMPDLSEEIDEQELRTILKRLQGENDAMEANMEYMRTYMRRQMFANLANNMERIGPKLRAAQSQPDLEAADMNDVHFLLWTEKDPNTFREIKVDDGRSLRRSGFDSRFPTFVLVHGWESSARKGWVVEAKTELLKSYGHLNVIAIDWSKLAANLYYPTVAKSVVPKVGLHSAKFLDFLHERAGLNITNIHLAGHSLGAHVSGFMGKHIINGPIGRITGLDPAGPSFRNVLPDKRLSTADAIFVEIIHSNGCNSYWFCFGLGEDIGHVDYYPNGGGRQAGCWTSSYNTMELLPTSTDQALSTNCLVMATPGENPIATPEWDPIATPERENRLGGTIGCAHQRAPSYWIESINSPVPFRSVPCPDWETYKAGNCSDCGQGCLDMGLHASTRVTGKYYLITNSKPPFAVHPEIHLTHS